VNFGIRKGEEGSYDVVHLPNNVVVGEVYQEVDGYYVFNPSTTRGYMNEYTLIGIAELLEVLNKSWDDEINTYFNGQLALFDVPWSDISRAGVQKMINGFHN
jgi:hypothetical protein